MRIIAGKHKGRNISSVDGMTARPTSDYNREMMFSTLYSMNIKMDNVLDLFSGTGALGVEALSRGATFVTFVEAAGKSISTIVKNIEKLNEQEKCTIVKKKVDYFLRNCSEQFSLIFADPPYDKSLVNETIYQIYENNLLTDDGVIVIEHSITEPIDEMYKKSIIKQKINNKTIVSFMELKL